MPPDDKQMATHKCSERGGPVGLEVVKDGADQHDGEQLSWEPDGVAGPATIKKNVAISQELSERNMGLNQGREADATRDKSTRLGESIVERRSIPSSSGRSPERIRRWRGGNYTGSNTTWEKRNERQNARLPMLGIGVRGNQEGKNAEERG